MTYIIGFIFALVLAAFIIVWIIYCMFCNERHKSEAYQYNISDLRRKNYEISLEQEGHNEKEVSAGFFVLSKKKPNEDHPYDKRPDYPEGNVSNLQPRTDKLIEIFDDSTLEAGARKCDLYEVDATLPHHSDV